MSDGQKTFWLSAAFVVVIAIGGVTLWKVTTAPSQDDLAALNAKIEQTNATLTQVQKATASEAITKGLAQLQDNIKGTNDALADIQRTIAAGNVRDRFDTLEKSIKSIDASLAAAQKSLPPADLASKVAAIDSEIKALNGKLADAPNADAIKGVTDQLAAIKQAMPQQGLGDRIAPLSDQIKALNGTLADIQKSSSLDGVKTQLAALSSKLESTTKALAGDGTEDAAALKTAVGDLQKSVSDVTKLKDALKPPPKEAVVFYLHMPNAENLPQKVASISPLDIQFEKIGSTDDNGQAAVIIPKLKALVEGRADCSISVAGYADTLGGDKVNLKISQRRARNIAQKIKEAFAGSKVQVNEAAWGERRLKNWTPDGTADENNRRVDIAVNCKS